MTSPSNERVGVTEPVTYSITQDVLDEVRELIQDILYPKVTWQEDTEKMARCANAVRVNAASRLEHIFSSPFGCSGR
jgi:hypothetical protein